MVKGDIVLVIFPFTDLSGSKLRPAVVLASTAIDVTVCFITTQTSHEESTDIQIQPNTINGLKKQSLVRVNKIATLHTSLVKGLLGRMNLLEIRELDNKLKVLFQINT